MNSKWFSLVLMIPVFIIFISCKDYKGEFSFKVNYDESYRRVVEPPEFSVDDSVKWVYSFKNIRRLPATEIGIIIMKKELIWVDVVTGSQRIGGETRFVYGTLPKLSPGDYRLVLTDIKNENKLINEISFLIYEDDTGVF